MIPEKKYVPPVSYPALKIPEARGIPIFGNSFQAMRNPLSFLISLKNKYPGLVCIRIGARKYYVTQDPDACRHVLQENAKNYYKPGAAKMMKRFLGEGLATSNGALWLKQRRLIQPAFHRKKVENLVHTIDKETEKLIHNWQTIPPGSQVNINQTFLKLTLGNITKTMFGTDLNAQVDEIARVINRLLASASRSVTSLVKFPAWFPTPANLKFKNANSAFEKIIYSIIEKRKQDPEKQHADLLDMLLHATDAEANNEVMPAKQLRDEITTIFMAGHETTAQTLSWVFYQLALYPDMYQKVKEETSRISQMGNPIEKINGFAYTKSLIEETMRLYPPVWIMARKSVDADTINGYRLPAGSTVLVNVYGMNHHESYWPGAETFCPERFKPEVQSLRHPFLFIPFGAGQRPCIGNLFAMMVMQVVVARMVQQFHFEIPSSARAIPEPNVTLRAKGGIHLIVKPNHTNR